MMRAEIKLSSLYDDYPAPSYATAGSAGLDVRAETELTDCVVIPPNEVHMIKTGVSIWLNDPGCAILALPKSGLGSKHGIILGNGTGLLDSDYQGEILLPIWNRTGKPYTIHRGDEIAQLVIVPVVQAQFDRVEEFSGKTERGSGGFGSTG